MLTEYQWSPSVNLRGLSYRATDNPTSPPTRTQGETASLGGPYHDPGESAGGAGRPNGRQAPRHDPQRAPAAPFTQRRDEAVPPAQRRLTSDRERDAALFLWLREAREVAKPSLHPQPQHPPGWARGPSLGGRSSPEFARICFREGREALRAGAPTNRRAGAWQTPAAVGRGSSRRL
jgi:hypothetical protein